jgi:predicted nucleic acid-binding protein
VLGLLEPKGVDMRVYLDTCSLQRPLDSKTDSRIHLEAEAILDVLSLCESGQIELVASEVLQFEIERIQDPLRRAHSYEALSKARTYVDMIEATEVRARELNESGIRPLDALHLAAAVETRADYFCTCDDKFLRRAKILETERTKVVSPLELIVELSL